MRRPLFWVALLLVIIAAVRLETGDPENERPGMISAQSLGSFEELILTGQVYKKDNQTLYLQDVSVHMQTFEGSQDPSQEAVSKAGSSRQSISCKDNIICKLTEAEEVPLGSYVTLRGSFVPISPATNPGEFDAAAYYRTIGVGGRLNKAELLQKGQTHWKVREWLYELRISLEERLNRALPQDQAGVLCALLLGDRGGLEERVENLYRQSGILHILSISSLHITIIGMSIYQLLRRLRVPVCPAALSGSVFLLLYGALTGFGVSACRAIGMYLIRMLGEVLGRTYDMLTALGVIGALMVWQNPYYLHHSGFLLSYASVLGVGVLCPALGGLGEGKRPQRTLVSEESKIRKMLQGAREKLQQSFTASLSVVLATLPVQLWFYYEAPVYSVFLNLLVLPLVKPLMLVGFLVMVLPWCQPAGIAAGGILEWYEWLCQLCGRLPFHTWNPGSPRLWQIGVYYLMLGTTVFILGKIRSTGTRCAGQHGTAWQKTVPQRTAPDSEGLRKVAAAIIHKWGIALKAAAGMLMVCSVLILGISPRTETKVTLLDVGQGDCILVQTGSGETYLFDCGSTSRTKVGEYVLVPFLKYSGIHTLDAVFVSHPDADHANGISELLVLGQESGIEIRQLILPDIAEELRKDQFSELIGAVHMADQKNPIEIRYISAGDGWECDSARFTCINPSEGCRLKNENAYSECFYVEFFEKKTRASKEPEAVTMLLTGDVEGEGEEALMHQLALRGIGSVDILKVAHHGSRGATSEEFLELIRPAISVISCGRNNRYGHPHPELLKRLETEGSMIISTAQCGAVKVRVKAGKVSVEGFCN